MPILHSNTENIPDKFNTNIWFPTYALNHKAGTAHLTSEEKGILFDLYCSYWDNEFCIKDEVKTLIRLGCTTTARWKRARQNIEPFFMIIDGIWHVKHLYKERIKATINRMKKKRAAYLKHNNIEKAQEIEVQMMAYIDAHADTLGGAYAQKSPMHVQCSIPTPLPIPPLPITTPSETQEVQ